MKPVVGSGVIGDAATVEAAVVFVATSVPLRAASALPSISVRNEVLSCKPARAGPLAAATVNGVAAAAITVKAVKATAVGFAMLVAPFHTLEAPFVTASVTAMVLVLHYLVK
jgi:hypothetical protein